MHTKPLSVLEMLWPHEEPPSAEEIRLRLAASAGAGESAVPDLPGSEDALAGNGADAPGSDPSEPSWREGLEPDGVRWHLPWRTREGDEALLSLGTLDPGALDLFLTVSPLDASTRARIREARWILPVAMPLDPKQPLESFQRQVRLAVAACPEALGFHDVAAHRIVAMARAEEVARWSAPPPALALYTVHAVYAPPDARTWWLHTHGLERAGLPDVEVLRVPDRYMAAAGQLIENFVRGILGREIPLRGECSHVFAGTRIAWMPAVEASVALRPGEPGCRQERGREHGHVGRRIALVAPGRRGRSWRLPIDLLRGFEEGEALVSLSPEESERTARLAREQWSVFGMLFTDHRSDPAWDFHVCVGLPTREGGREYLWWQVLEIRPNGVRARLVNEPLAVDGWKRGAETWHDLAEMTDWAVGTPSRVLRPASLVVPA